MQRSLFISNKRIQKTEVPSLKIKDGNRIYTWSNGRSYIEWADGDKVWYLNGNLHRVDGPAIEWANGTKEWYLNCKRHREDGPAIEWANGTKAWYLNGKHHREDGPAIERANGDKEWYLNGEEYTKEEYDKIIRDSI